MSVFIPTHSTTSPQIAVVKPVFDGVYLLGLHRILPCGRHRASIVWMNRLHPTSRCQVLNALTGEFAPARAVPDKRPMRVADPNNLRRCADERLEAGLRTCELSGPFRDAHFKLVFRLFKLGQRRAMRRDFSSQALIHDTELARTGNRQGLRDKRKDNESSYDRNDCRCRLDIGLRFINRPPQRQPLHGMRKPAEENEQGEKDGQRFKFEIVAFFNKDPNCKRYCHIR
jgi:hypothetical protein